MEKIVHEMGPLGTNAEVSKQIAYFLLFLPFSNIVNTGHLLDIMFIFDKYHCNSIVVILIQYDESDSNNLMGMSSRMV